MKAKFLAITALILGMVSCQKDATGFDVVVDGEQETTITVSLPETTRANSAQGFDLTTLGSNYDIRYILEIYRVDNNEVLYDDCQRFVETSDGTSMVFPVRLAPGYDYRIVAWADIVEDGSEEDRYYYTQDGLDNVVIKDNNTVKWNAMDETRDAYTYVKVVKDFNSLSNLDMSLTRPFAKLRVVATDITDIRKVGLEPTTATVEYRQPMYFKYNAVADIENKGAANDAKTKRHEFTYATTATQYDDNNGEYTLFSDYIFVPSTSTAKFYLAVMDANGDTIKETEFNTDIFVERNKLTTIKGDVLTTGGNVTVKVENELGVKETYTYVDTAEDLQAKINDAVAGEETHIVLGGDIDLSNGIMTLAATRTSERQYGLEIPAGKEVVLDLKGYTISQSKEQTGAYSMIDNKGTLTIEDSSETKSGKIVYGDTGNGGNYASNTIWNRGVLTINGGTIENNSYATVASNGFPHPIDNYGVLTINGGTFTNSANYSSMRIWCTTDDDTIITINGGTFNGSIDFQTPNASANKGTLTINGGTFYADTYTKCSVRLLGFGADVDEMNGYIKGGRFNGAIALKNWSGSELNSKVFNITGGTFTVDPSEFVDDDYNVVVNSGIYSLERKADVAKIGEVGYTSLAKAIAAVEDGGTITLVANVKFDKFTRTHNSGNWYDGLYYIGDKSFTIDLNGKIISHDGSVNDYLLNFKNVGSKENTIILKNGTLDAGTSAYCALATSSSNESKITINLEDVNLVGNNSGGAVAKIRGGAELNVKAGTVITGKNSYVGIEAAGNNTVVNIYDNVNIYQNGTGSYVGGIVGASQNATMNIYGGYGKSAKCGIIVMSTGATINVSGGEWIANNDGTVAAGNNGVLVSQNNRNESSWACKSILNVTGGTFKGGYDCWGMGPGVEPNDAQINIKGGNFNANPSSYLAEGCEATETNGVWNVSYNPYYDYENVSEGLLKKDNAYVVNNANGLATLNAMMVDKSAGRNISVSLNADIDFTGKKWTPVDSHGDFGFEIAELNGNGHTISNLTINGQAMFTRFAGVGNGVIIKDITFDNATVNSNGNINTAIIAGHTYLNVLLDNVDVKNSTITGGYKVAPLIGTVYNESPSKTITATLKNCDVEEVTVKATSYDFCTTGMVAFVYADDNDTITFENCSVKDVKLYAPNVYTAHAAIYTTGSETLFNEAEGVTVTNVTFKNI